MLICVYSISTNLIGLQAQISELQFEKLSSGEIIVEAVNDSSGLPGVKAMFEISGTRTEIWGMLNDYENFKKIYGNIDSLKVLEADSSGAIIEFWSDAVIKKMHFTLIRKYEVYEQKLSWERLSGDMKRIEGGWEILDSREAGKKILVYKTFIKYGGIIPTKLVRRGAMNKAKSLGPKLQEWLQKYRHLYN